ncbi:ATP-binding protein [Yersinia frederiksenii]|uniref:ATP-binding protein n=1 Tax=Yersinia frederiksenii TaxID=29484 RepID=UPI0005DBD601|nr:ATP-binding protein [Yersinia frederiksenii]CNE74274.1 hybrid sensory kinase in two-component regulatory system with RcsB and YojN [Yersinia frederiksenii]
MFKSSNNILNPTRQAPHLPKALLYLFATALLCCLIVALVFYVYFLINSTISDYRRQMNAAAYNAQYFFDEREELLRSMAASAIHLPKIIAVENSKPAALAEVIVLPLQNSGNRQHGIIITQRDKAALERSHTHLIYTSMQSGKTSTVIPVEGGSLPVISPESQVWIAGFLASHDWQSGKEGALPIAWINPPNDNDSTLYLFTPLEVDDLDAGWLGLTFHQIAASIDLSTLQGVGYDLIDPQGLPALHSNNVSHESRHWEGKFIKDMFGLTGKKWFPEYLVLRKSVGHAGWSLVYTVPIRQLFKDNLPMVRTAFFIFISLIICVIVSLYYLSRRVLQPAMNQFSALVDSEKLNRKMVETASVGLGLVRCTDGALLFSNDLVKAWIENDRDWQTRITTAEGKTADYELSLDDGRTIQLSCIPTTYGGDAVILSVISDISGLKAIERSLVESRRMAESANQAKTLFLTTMSHEIRTPLYGILGTLELFALSDLYGQQYEYMKTLLHSSSSLLRIVNDSLDLSRIEAGQLTLEIMPFSPMELAELVVEAYAAKAESKGLQIYTISDTQVPLQVMGDAIRVRQVLDNLVNNAIKFTISGHIILRLYASEQSGDSVSLTFQVVDTGVGIDSEHLPYLFEPYFLSEQNPAEPQSGSGLGLSICSRLAQLMGGGLQAISERNLGTRITFEATFSLADGNNMATQLRLLSEPVFIDGAVPEVVSNLCQWLRLWGAQALPFRNVTPRNHHRGILIQAWPPSLQSPEWTGKRILALPLTLGPKQVRDDDALIVGAYSVIAIGRAVQAVQQNTFSASTISKAFAAEKLDLRVLVVDDSPISHTVLREQLTRLGCEVVTATEGYEVVNLSDIHTFDAVLTDLYMPGLDGYGLTRTLRRQGYNGQIIGLTGSAYPEEKRKGKEAGMNRLLRKPLSLVQLHSLLHKLDTHRN